MKKSGQIVLFRFAQTNLAQGKLRPALLIGRLPGKFDDWLICMISSQLQQCVPGFDEQIDVNDPDFGQSGLKCPSVVRVGRLAVVAGNRLRGAAGEIAAARLDRIRRRLADWLLQA